MKTAIVTGASGNLGQAVVKKFLDEGFKVIGTVHHNTAHGGNNTMFERSVVDLTDEAQSLQFVEAVVASYGNIDAAVLTVGGFAMGKIADTKSSDIGQQYKLNFETAYNIARPVFLQMMKQKAGRIFLIGSRPGLEAKAGKGVVAYGLAKSLIFRLAEIMNEEARGSDVVTSVIVPSTIDTPQNRESMADASFDNWVKAEEIADVIYYCCSDQGKVLREPLLKVYGKS